MLDCLLIFMLTAIGASLLAFLQGGINNFFSNLFSSHYLSDFFKVFFTSSLLEELFKFLFFILLYKIAKKIDNKNNFKHHVVCVFTFFITFVLIETIIYIYRYNTQILAQRLLISLPLHLSTLFILFNYFYEDKKLKGFLLAWGLHFIINFFYISSDWIILAAPNSAKWINLFCFLITFVVLWICLILVLLSLRKKYINTKTGDSE